jgi:hypothetical protein
MAFPYPDDKLNQDNTIDPSVRNNFYGAVSSTPRGIFNGQTQNNNYGNWATILNSIGSQISPIELKISGYSTVVSLTVNANVKQTSSIQGSNLSIFFVVVETVNYQGRNGVNPHKNVVRKMFPSANGKSFSLALNQSLNISETFPLNSTWDKNQLNIIVFIQDLITKEVYQSESLSYNQFIAATVEKDFLPNNFNLSQNYPNPFNPETTINFQLPKSEKVVLKIYDALGREVETLVNGEKNSGLHKIIFNAKNLSSGIYFYRLTAGSFYAVKKMTISK